MSLSHVYAIVATIPGWENQQAMIAPLGGLTNQNYRVDLADQSFALRLGGKGTALLGIDRHRELAATRTAAAAGIGPEVVYADPVQDILITRIIDGPCLTAERVSQPDVLERIVAALRHFHGGPAFPQVFSAFATVRNYHQLGLEYGVGFEAQASQALTVMETLASSLDPPPRLSPCHNDLLAGNFIDSAEGLRIIDWEYAAMGDLFFDLGNFAANHELDQPALEQLLSLYFGRVEPADLARLQLMQAVSNLREAFWGLLQSGISQLGIDYKAYAQTYLERFLEASSEFAGQLARS